MKKLNIILIVTYECNLRCKYCNTVKKTGSISDEILEKVANFLSFSVEYDEINIKFFGGEPLLYFERIKRFHDFLKNCKKRLNQKISYELTTNGILLDNEKLAYFLDNNYQISVSNDGLYSTHSQNRVGNPELLRLAYDRLLELDANQKKELYINMVITPSVADILYDNFIFLVNNGFKKFNFLPQSYTNWDLLAVANLRRGLAAVSDFVLSNNDIEIKNGKTNNRLFFFNSGLVVDADGSVYFNNSIMTTEFEWLKKILKIGNILEYKSFDDLIGFFRSNSGLQSAYKKAEHVIVKKNNSNRLIDLELTRFVNLISK